MAYRSSRPEVLCTKGVLPATLLKRSLWHRCFPVNFPKFLRTPLLIFFFFFNILLFIKLLVRETRKMLDDFCIPHFVISKKLQ